MLKTMQPSLPMNDLDFDGSGSSISGAVFFTEQSTVARWGGLGSSRGWRGWVPIALWSSSSDEH